MKDISTAIMQQIRRLNPAAKILSCDHMVTYLDSRSWGDPSYAAICTFDFGGESSYTAAVCDDRLIGKFTLGGGNQGDIRRSEHDYQDYIAENCPPGG